MEIRDEELKKIVSFVAGTEKAQVAYPQLVEHFISQRYNVHQELAIHRQRNVKPEQFNEYDAYCEQCKQEAKVILGLEVENND